MHGTVTSTTFRLECDQRSTLVNSIVNCNMDNERRFHHHWSMNLPISTFAFRTTWEKPIVFWSMDELRGRVQKRSESGDLKRLCLDDPPRFLHSRFHYGLPFGRFLFAFLMGISHEWSLIRTGCFHSVRFTMACKHIRASVMLLALACLSHCVDCMVRLVRSVRRSIFDLTHACLHRQHAQRFQFNSLT